MGWLGAALVTAASCADVAPTPIRPKDTAFPRWEQTWAIATHNSYWVDRGTPNDAFASGVGERILDQLLGDGARSIEIDIHRDREHPGKFVVYHTEPGNSVCGTLAECLSILRTFHDALPNHAPTLVVIELKEVAEPNFDDTHTFDDLDAELRAGLGDLLFSPRNQLDRCAAAGMEPDAASGAIDLGACVDQLRWPPLDEMRGRFVVGVLGNWDVVANATVDWTKYATTKLTERAAFPMSSTWKLDYDTLPPRVTERITRAELERAARSSVLVQVEDPADPALAPSIARGAIVRIDGANSKADQNTRLNAGAQLLQTDTPWIRTDEFRVDAPVRSFREDVRLEDLVEPGARLALLSSPADHRVAAWLDHPSMGPWSFASTIVAGHDGGDGCLEIATDDRTSFVLACRTRFDGIGTTSAQLLGYQVLSVSNGQIESSDTLTPEDQTGAERVTLRVSPGTVDSCIEAGTATGTGTGEPLGFARLGEVRCVAGTLTRAAIVRGPDDGVTPALFVRTTIEEGGVETPVASANLVTFTEPANVASEEPPTPAPDRLVDLSR